MMTHGARQANKWQDDHAYSEPYRLECEARWAMSLTLKNRRKYLGMIKNLDRLAALKAEIMRQWRKNTHNKKR